MHVTINILIVMFFSLFISVTDDERVIRNAAIQILESERVALLTRWISSTAFLSEQKIRTRPEWRISRMTFYVSKEALGLMANNYLVPWVIL